MADFMDKALNWDDEIENDGQEYTIIPEGDYHFGVLGYERGWHSGSDKMPACNKAVVKLAILGPEYPFKNDKLGEVSTNLFLSSRFEWKLCQFFTSIGMRKHGEKLKMNWNKIQGAEGDCHVGIRKWVGNDGKERESNEITKFYDPAESPLKPEEQTDLYGASPAGGSFTPGKF